MMIEKLGLSIIGLVFELSFTNGLTHLAASLPIILLAPVDLAL
jgi:hypothetical protein